MDKSSLKQNEAMNLRKQNGVPHIHLR